MMSKIIYQPKGKAGEYGKYAANFYTGCSGCCEYCYNRKGITAKTLGGDKPTLKKSLNSPIDALIKFQKELNQDLGELQRHGVFFNFVSDPCLSETWNLNLSAIHSCLMVKVPTMFLTKQTWWVQDFLSNSTSAGTWLNNNIWKARRLTAIGFTLTGHDEMESGCASNAERIEAMKQLHEAGFKTWASIEPIIDFDSSYRMMELTLEFCDLYKVGLQSGKKYDMKATQEFTLRVMAAARCNHTKVYFKDSLVSRLGVTRETMSQWQWGDCLVDCDYNMFAE